MAKQKSEVSAAVHGMSEKARGVRLSLVKTSLVLNGRHYMFRK
jgi:hypothetical protein